MQFALTIVLMVGVVMYVARWLDPRTVGRATIRIDEAALATGKGKRNG